MKPLEPLLEVNEVKTSAKICGLRVLEHALLAAELGAGMVGFVHFSPSPRHVAPADIAPIAEQLRAQYPAVKLVAVLVNPTDEEVAEAVAAYRPDFLQLHGTETHDRALTLRTRHHVSIIKALSVADRQDLEAAYSYAGSVDMLLLDAKPQPDDLLPGGNGRSFDWSILKGMKLPGDLPWLLSGGLTPENVAEAAIKTEAPWVDVSSGVEYQPGEKDPAMIRAFLAALQS